MKRLMALALAGLLLLAAPGALADYGGDSIFAQDTSAISVVDYGSDTQLTDKYGTYYVSNCFDHNLNTCWAEGVSGDGIDSFIWGSWAVNRGRWLLLGVVIWGGYQKSDDVFYKNNRPCDVYIDVYCDGARVADSARMSDVRAPQVLYFDQPMLFSDQAEVTLSLESVYLGSKYHDTCITDIDLIVRAFN